MIFYTDRRPVKGVAATVGNPIGVCVSDNFTDWRFLGYCKFDGVGGKPDSEQTRWAPGIIIDGDTYICLLLLSRMLRHLGERAEA